MIESVLGLTEVGDSLVPKPSSYCEQYNNIGQPRYIDSDTPMT